jgi:hypothetical protein
LEKSDYAEIRTLMEQLNICEEGRLKPLFDAMDGVWDYGILKCVMAAECG